MKTKKQLGAHPVIGRLRKIMNDKNITQTTMAEYAGIEPSQFSKVMNGNVQISLWQLSNIATSLNFELIDIFTYPEKYRKQTDNANTPQLKTSLTIELKPEQREKVLQMIFNKEELDLLK